MEVGGKILVGSVEPACDSPYHVYPDDPESVYPGGELSGLTEQWTNQVYRAGLRMPTLPMPASTETQGVVACYDVTPDWTPIYDKSALPVPASHDPLSPNKAITLESPPRSYSLGLLHGDWHQWESVQERGCCWEAYERDHRGRCHF